MDYTTIQIDNQAETSMSAVLLNTNQGVGEVGVLDTRKEASKVTKPPTAQTFMYSETLALLLILRPAITMTGMNFEAECIALGTTIAGGSWREAPSTTISTIIFAQMALICFRAAIQSAGMEPSWRIIGLSTSLPRFLGK